MSYTLSAEQLTVPLKTFQVVGKPCQLVDDPDTHFPEHNRREKGGRAKYEAKVRFAKSLCESCDVIDRCLKFAIDNRISHGIWGGTTPEERKNLLNQKEVQL